MVRKRFILINMCVLFICLFSLVEGSMFEEIYKDASTKNQISFQSTFYQAPQRVFLNKNSSLFVSPKTPYELILNNKSYFFRISSFSISSITLDFLNMSDIFLYEEIPKIIDFDGFKINISLDFVTFNYGRLSFSESYSEPFYDNTLIDNNLSVVNNNNNNNNNNNDYNNYNVEADNDYNENDKSDNVNGDGIKDGPSSDENIESISQKTNSKKNSSLKVNSSSFDAETADVKINLFKRIVFSSFFILLILFFIFFIPYFLLVKLKSNVTWRSRGFFFNSWKVNLKLRKEKYRPHLKIFSNLKDKRNSDFLSFFSSSYKSRNPLRTKNFSFLSSSLNRSKPGSKLSDKKNKGISNNFVGGVSTKNSNVIKDDSSSDNSHLDIISPTNISSYDEYEALKKKLEEELDQKKIKK